MLEPVERVRVQLPALIRRLPGMEPVLTTGPQSVPIKTSVMIEGERMHAYSDDTMAIELSERIRPQE